MSSLHTIRDALQQKVRALKQQLNIHIEQMTIDFADIFGRSELARKTRQRRQERQKAHDA